jgi:hypothetical protein
LGELLASTAPNEEIQRATKTGMASLWCIVGVNECEDLVTKGWCEERLRSIQTVGNEMAEDFNRFFSRLTSKGRARGRPSRYQSVEYGLHGDLRCKTLLSRIKE